MAEQLRVHAHRPQALQWADSQGWLDSKNVCGKAVDSLWQVSPFC